MEEERNTEWGEGQEKESDRELLQLSFFSAIWRAQRKIGDEYGRSSSHSQSLSLSFSLYFSWMLFSLSLSFSFFHRRLPSEFLWSSFCQIYTSLFSDIPILKRFLTLLLAYLSPLFYCLHSSVPPSLLISHLLTSHLSLFILARPLSPLSKT